jgi:hypothetical protein
MKAYSSKSTSFGNRECWVPGKGKIHFTDRKVIYACVEVARQIGLEAIEEAEKSGISVFGTGVGNFHISFIRNDNLSVPAFAQLKKQFEGTEVSFYFNKNPVSYSGLLRLEVKAPSLDMIRTKAGLGRYECANKILNKPYHVSLGRLL